LGAGFETTANALSVMLHYLAYHSEVDQHIREQPALIPTAVGEFLRFAHRFKFLDVTRR
jgi:cytochrome P450